MDYRSPVVSLQHTLAALEAELAALRALPPARPRPSPALFKKARRRIEDEKRVIRGKLKRLSKKLAIRSDLRDDDESPPPTPDGPRNARRLGLASMMLGALLTCVHFGAAVGAPVAAPLQQKLSYKGIEFAGLFAVVGMLFFAIGLVDDARPKKWPDP
jgi:hypothetical protein